MEPHIQYAKTEDGVSIAYWTLGEGKPFVYMQSLGVNHLEVEWQYPELRRWYERLARRRMLVRYDGRGTGLSDRSVTGFSLDAHILDLEAVVDRLGLDTFALCGFLNAGPVVIAYAARHPERISHLLLWSTYARYADYSQSREVEAIRSLIDRDWELFTETVAHALTGYSAGAEARRVAAWLRESVTPEVYQAIVAASRDFNVLALLRQVSSPTLVLHRREALAPTMEAVRGLATGIPNARLALLEGASMAPWMGDMEAVLTAMDEFLGEGAEDEPAEAPAPTGMVTILFTDMESSTALTQRLGDQRAQELVRTHNTIVRDALQTRGGSEIKHTGDGIMASFSTASAALGCAMAIQKAVAARAEEQPDIPLGLRVGLNAGEPVVEEQDLFGASVQLARRICDHAEPGQILASNVVRELAMGKGFLFGDIGEVVPKGFEEPVRLYEVRWRES